MILAPKAGLNRGYWWFLLRFLGARLVVLPTLPIDKPLVRRRFGHIGPQGPSSFKVCVADQSSRAAIADADCSCSCCPEELHI